ncbi:NADPH-dependent 7-cyano-7-deazaguanine reductase QueF [Aliikangiella marina]|nr:NADPH-dependent 7-cyano-7-deazaguanine reductase QueF [Aliikangiella marina]
MSEIPLGKSTQYISVYTPELLFPILRSEKRDELDNRFLDFKGKDIWNAFEISWLNPKGLPKIAIGVFEFDAGTPKIIESKSFKLYLNSFNQSRFSSLAEVQSIMAKDLSAACGGEVSVELIEPANFNRNAISQLEGEVIDDIDIEIAEYAYNPSLLANSTSDEHTSEVLVSHLLKSNCLITSQPDWASIQIRYTGSKIDRAKLLAYLISFRSHNEFHEQCVERIFADIKSLCAPEKLTVYARYTRRGGLDINPWRSDFELDIENVRLARQ